MAMDPQEMLKMLQQQQGGGEELPVQDPSQGQDPNVPAPVQDPNMPIDGAGGMPPEEGQMPPEQGMPMEGQPQTGADMGQMPMMPAEQPQQPQDPTEAIIGLIMKRAQETTLNAEVQAKVLLTLAQAFAQLNQEQPQQIPPEAQYQLEITKIQMEHERLSAESEQKLQIMQQESEQKQQLAEMKAQMDQQIAQSKMEIERENAQVKNDIAEAHAVNDAEIKQRDSIVRAKQAEDSTNIKKSQAEAAAKKPNKPSK